ncbi:hypothetical protein [Streptomyces chryseus]|uniref:Uncharacterized protein n=1 Tax=Streptomyces chryseus TaxID=68186 RepID=A0ABQ3DH11_9ACTN|nr:hypothetical protein [Streptomyces chryseus]GHA94459.1 hypothetical protein GCM10010346_16530 [Streptomyces chryseus]
MPEKKIQADDLKVGDVITSTPEPVTVREISTGPGGMVITNPTAEDEVTGRAWEWVTVDRP